MDKLTIYRKPMGENLFEEEFTVETLSQMGNPLERLSSLVDFEMFRPVLEEVLLTKECKTPAGRKPIDVVLMFKVIDDWATDTDYKVFTGTGTITITGTPTFEPTVPMEGYLWDYSALASDGILRVVADPTGIEEITEEELRNMDVYDLNGRKQSAVNFKKGIYIINGKKYLVK